MKFRYTTKCKSLYLAYFLLLFTVACKKDDIAEDPQTGSVNAEHQTVNNWVLERMRYFYYWNNEIPSDRSLDFNQAPEPFFRSLLHGDDRFSVIQDVDALNDSYEGISKTTGMSIALFRVGPDDDVMAMVRYVLKGSPADVLGLKRGDILTQFNGIGLTLDNYNTVFEGSYYGNDPYTVAIARLEGNTLFNDRTVTLSPIEFQEKVVHQTAVFHTAGGNRVGYLFYNRFLTNQARDLVDSIAKLKAEGISDLVLDLRYNPGGLSDVTGLLCGLIQSGFNENSEFMRYVFNSNLGQTSRSYKEILETTALENSLGSNPIAIINANNLNLSRVFVLATGSTASASEVVINNLRPFLGDANVIHIGDTTVGKNEGAYVLQDDRNPRVIDWAIQPIVMKIANGNGFGDYPNGLVPNYAVNEWDVFPFVALGTREDPLIARALSIIDPSMPSVSSLSGRVMSARGTTPGTLRVYPVEGFEDKTRPVLPIGTNDKLDHERFFEEMR